MASKKVKILFLGSSPEGTQRLSLDKEIKAITRAIRASEHRDVLELSSRWAVDADDLLQALNEEKPVVVHFSGHGSAIGEIMLVDARGKPKPVSAEALKALFTALKDNIRLVVLNACYSKTQAAAISEVIDCVIGMSDEISDTASVAFAASFYRAIGFRRSIREAFEQGKASLLSESIPEETTPELTERDGVDARSVVLVDAASDEISLPRKGVRTPLDPASVIEAQTEFFNSLTQALWKWRYMAIEVAYYGRQGGGARLTSIAQSYDEGAWSVFSQIRVEISRAQRYVSFDTYLQLRALYTYIVDFDKQLSNLIFLPETRPNQDLHQWRTRMFSSLNDFIYTDVTEKIEASIASVAAELSLALRD